MLVVFQTINRIGPILKDKKKVAPTPCVINFKLELCTPLS